MRQNKETQDQNEVIEWPNAQYPSEVEVLNLNGLGSALFFKQEEGDEKTTQDEKEVNPKRTKF